MSPNSSDRSTSVAHATRRRGATLESALLDATWQLLLDNGYDELTYDEVATRAKTSRAVLYRRWPTKVELVRAAVTRALTQDRIEVPNTGNLRDDAIAALRQLNQTRIRVGLQLAARLNGYYDETGTTLLDLGSTVVGDRGPIFDELLARADRRGEIHLAAVPTRVRHIAMDLFRHEALITRRPVDETVIESIVDDVFMPLLKLSSPYPAK